MPITHIISLQQSDLNLRLAARCQAIGLNYLSLCPFSIEFLPWQATITASFVNAQDRLIFLSPNAVSGFFKAGALAFLNKTPWIAIGAGTGQALAKHSATEILIPSIPSSEGLLALAALTAVQHQQLMLVKGMGGRDLLMTELTKRGARVSELICYQRVIHSINIPPLLKIWQNNQQPLLLATSFAALNAVVSQLPAALVAWFLQKKLVVSSERLYNLAIQLGFTNVERVSHVSETELFTAIQAIKERL